MHTHTDDEGPDAMKERARSAMYDYSNQYPSLLGVPELRQAVARHSQTNQSIDCDWLTETLVTVGATEGIAAAFMGWLNAGDEGAELEFLTDHAEQLPLASDRADRLEPTNCSGYV
jgi:aspartate/methionine/tyrosine aminotransferase